MNHIHIMINGKVVGTLSLDERGHVVGDGSKAAENAMFGMNHKMGPEHGQKLLDEIVKRLGTSTRVSAHHCSEQH